MSSVIDDVIQKLKNKNVFSTLTFPDPTISPYTIEYETENGIFPVLHILEGTIHNNDGFLLEFTQVRDFFFSTKIDYVSTPTIVVFKHEDTLFYGSLGDFITRGEPSEVDSGYFILDKMFMHPIEGSLPLEEPSLVQFLKRNFMPVLGRISKDDLGKEVTEVIRKFFRLKPGTTSVLISDNLELQLREPRNTMGAMLVSTGSMLGPQETGSGTMPEVQREAEEYGFGANKEWWVRDLIDEWCQTDFGIVPNRDYSLEFTGAGAGDPRILSSRESTLPDIVFKVPGENGNPVFFLEVTGDGGYWINHDIRDLLIQRHGGTYEPGNVILPNKRESKRGKWFQDNIPKFRALKLNEAPVFWVYVFDLTANLEDPKKSKIRHLHSEEVDIGEYRYPDLVDAYFLELGQLIQHSSIVDAKKIGSIFSGGRGRTEYKLCIKTKQVQDFNFEKTFPQTLKAMLKLANII